MRNILFIFLCLINIYTINAQNSENIKIGSAKREVSNIVGRIQTITDSLDRLISYKDSLIQVKDSLIINSCTVYDTVIEYRLDTLRITQQEDSLAALKKTIQLKDSLISTFIDNLCYADTCMVKYAYGLCYKKYDYTLVEEAKEIIHRLYQPEIKKEMENSLLVLLMNYEKYYNSLLEIFTAAQEDTLRESSVFIDDFKIKYINKVKGTTYYQKHYKQYWMIAYLDGLIDEAMKIIENHSRENKSDFTNLLKKYEK